MCVRVCVSACSYGVRACMGATRAKVSQCMSSYVPQMRHAAQRTSANFENLNTKCKRTCMSGLAILNCNAKFSIAMRRSMESEF